MTMIQYKWYCGAKTIERIVVYLLVEKKRQTPDVRHFVRYKN